jgi:hypothetical protein
MSQLDSNGGKEYASVTSILHASREEKTCSKTFPIVVFLSDSAGDCGLSGAGHAVQPEDALFVTPISPCPNLVENVDSSILEAQRVMLLIGSVKGCLSSMRQEFQ